MKYFRQRKKNIIRYCLYVESKYIYIYTYVHIYIHTYVCVYIYIYTMNLFIEQKQTHRLRE